MERRGQGNLPTYMFSRCERFGAIIRQLLCLPSLKRILCSRVQETRIPVWLFRTLGGGSLFALQGTKVHTHRLGRFQPPLLQLGTTQPGFLRSRLQSSHGIHFWRYDPAHLLNTIMNSLAPTGKRLSGFLGHPIDLRVRTALPRLVTDRITGCLRLVGQ